MTLKYQWPQKLVHIQYLLSSHNSQNTPPLPREKVTFHNRVMYTYIDTNITRTFWLLNVDWTNTNRLADRSGPALSLTVLLHWALLWLAVGCALQAGVNLLHTVTVAPGLVCSACNTETGSSKPGAAADGGDTYLQWTIHSLCRV